MIDTNRLKGKFQAVYDFAAKQLRYLIETYPDYFPMYTQQGKWKHTGEAWTNWCEGFLGGQLWLLYEQTEDNYWRTQAEHYSRLIEHRKADNSVHDLGFLFMPTYKRWYDLTGDPKLGDILVTAGTTAASRFREKGAYLPSFVAPESLFIDIMMNVGIILLAAEKSGKRELLEIAKRHSLTTRRYLIRGDGSVSHEGLFDLDTGEFLRQTTHQGWRNDSSWARGLAWAVYGFGTVYHYTHDPIFLNTAEQCASYYIANTPAHGVPPNDWLEPNPVTPYESSAAAVTASGLLNLAQWVTDPIRRYTYLQYALQILDTLTEPEFVAFNDGGWEGILKHGSYHEKKRLGVDESVMWGEYFFLEAVQKAWKII